MSSSRERKKTEKQKLKAGFQGFRVPPLQSGSLVDLFSLKFRGREVFPKAGFHLYPLSRRTGYQARD
ncbi:hypothetical protein AKJ41_02505 [candidate division MSBL1 archaeon SCGC-AAA259O05]|uniref:Uncharacterized protein n=1 Tax=candidate division MSBL1 archaeon SCGC-AAA259O05 TaxID=1698271 RepID=A0A133V430_9EURY|nr:hypothetical protein AKJ41_02505 [candidate division MSBL1 archaeon SCGC-AAA259O05]